MKISTIIFDLGGVLVETHWNKVTEPLSKLTGLIPEQVMDELIKGDAYNPFMSGQFDSNEFHRRMTRQFSIDIEPNALFDMWNSVIVPSPEAAQIVGAFRGRFRLVMGSNTDPLHYQAGLDVQPLLSHIKEGILSFNVGHLKPDAEFFRKGLHGLGVKPDEAIFMDDRADNVEAARSVGITAFQFTSGSQAQVELKRLDLL